MQYLGKISGDGMLKCDGEEVARASYEFEGYFKRPIGVTSCGEIKAAPTALKGVFGRKGVQLLADDGRLFNLRFSEKALSSDSDIAHVDVTGELPTTPQNWRS